MLLAEEYGYFLYGIKTPYLHVAGVKKCTKLKSMATSTTMTRASIVGLAIPYSIVAGTIIGR